MLEAIISVRGPLSDNKAETDFAPGMYWSTRQYKCFVEVISIRRTILGWLSLERRVPSLDRIFPMYESFMAFRSTTLTAT